MLRLNNLNISILHNKSELSKKIAHILNIKENEIISYKIRRQSVDARKKEDILYSYNIDVEVKDENKILKKSFKNNNISKSKDIIYKIECTGDKKIKYRPVIVGFGPAGIFAALSLARAGLKPIVIERGEDVDSRTETVEEFWTSGKLNEESNVSFGEGGAGTFSDGKLNTLVKDSTGRNTFVLETLVKHGADEKILYDYKPHVGTDKLKDVVKSIREEIKSLGADIRFNTCMKEILYEDNKIEAIRLSNGEIIKTDILILACGHSARDTFYMLNEKKVDIEAKSFAVGLRVIHSQEMIDKSQFGEKFYRQLSPAPYKLSYTTKDGRGVYSFCMCPGGYVVNASSLNGKMVVNGMSYNDRASSSANSAIIVTVDKKDFEKYTGKEGVLAGLYFQEMLEKKVFDLGNSKIPVQLYGDFIKDQSSKAFGKVKPDIKGLYTFANINEVLPEYISSSIKEAMPEFDKKISGFAGEDTILLAIESRTSSPIKIIRDENMQANIRGLFPCGEGAGYAGGITSAAMDGLKVAEFITKTYSF